MTKKQIDIQCQNCKEWRKITYRAKNNLSKLCRKCQMKSVHKSNKRNKTLICEKCGDEFTTSTTTYSRIESNKRDCVCSLCMESIKWIKVQCNNCGEERLMRSGKAREYKGTSCPLCKKTPKKNLDKEISDKAKAIKAQEATMYRIDTDASFLQPKTHQIDWDKEKKMIDKWLSNNKPTILEMKHQTEPYQSGQIMQIGT